ncbi:MAG: hypothetical protein ABSA93_34270 [Streptosporangiaceae bacterium]
MISAEELRVLRDIWSARAQDDIDCADARSCKRMTDVGFDELAQEYDGDLRAAWRATLKREGKLRDRVHEESR